MRVYFWAFYSVLLVCVSVIMPVPYCFFFFLLLVFWSCWMTCRTLVPQPGIKPMRPAVEAWSPGHWTAREFPSTYCFDYCIFVVGFEIKKYKASTFVFLKIVWTIMDLWDSVWILGYCFLFLQGKKKAIEILMEIALNLW